MRKILYTHRFKRDYKRELSGKYGKKLNADLTKIVGQLAADEVLPNRCGTGSVQYDSTLQNIFKFQKR